MSTSSYTFVHLSTMSTQNMQMQQSDNDKYSIMTLFCDTKKPCLSALSRIPGPVATSR